MVRRCPVRCRWRGCESGANIKTHPSTRSHIHCYPYIDTRDARACNKPAARARARRCPSLARCRERSRDTISKRRSLSVMESLTRSWEQWAEGRWSVRKSKTVTQKTSNNELSFLMTCCEIFRALRSGMCLGAISLGSLIAKSSPVQYGNSFLQQCTQ